VKFRQKQENLKIENSNMQWIFAGFVNRQKLREEEKGPQKKPAIFV
jgi:hypothetical protein